MQIVKVNDEFTISAQIQLTDLGLLAQRGIRTVICNRPDGEASDQPTFSEISAEADRQGIKTAYLPVKPGAYPDGDIKAFADVLASMDGPFHAFCRTGTRSISLWALTQLAAGTTTRASLLEAATAAGYDLSQTLPSDAASRASTGSPATHYDVLIVGGGAAGIAVASSILKRTDKLSVAIVDPADVHYYQPGWTMVGGGIFDPEDTVRTMGSLIPKGVDWIKAAVGRFDPESHQVVLENSQAVSYERLIVATGLKLNWGAVEGLVESLGRNGVTSNYRYDLAPYTWRLVSAMRSGKALFTQPPMPIKCAGAPQKALYLSADHWTRQGVLKDISIDFYNAGAALFGVKDYVPALMEYIDRYQAQLHFSHNLARIDGENRRAVFTQTDGEGNTAEVETDFDMIHVCPPQTAPDFIRESSLADAAGWVDVDQNTLRHKRFDDIWSLGDVMNAPNAKTAAAARMQAPIVANNLLESLELAKGIAHYNGYGSCPLTVERGKIVLAEFGYGGKLLPSFPTWILNGKRPSRLAWLLKEQILPPVYWKAMLRGKEWMVSPEQSKTANS